MSFVRDKYVAPWDILGLSCSRHVALITGHSMNLPDWVNTLLCVH